MVLVIMDMHHVYLQLLEVLMRYHSIVWPGQVQFGSHRGSVDVEQKIRILLHRNYDHSEYKGCQARQSI